MLDFTIAAMHSTTLNLCNPFCMCSLCTSLDYCQMPAMYQNLHHGLYNKCGWKWYKANGCPVLWYCVYSWRKYMHEYMLHYKEQLLMIIKICTSGPVFLKWSWITVNSLYCIILKDSTSSFTCNWQTPFMTIQANCWSIPYYKVSLAQGLDTMVRRWGLEPTT